MSLTCTRCESSGFLNIHQIPEDICRLWDNDGHEVIIEWMKSNTDNDVQVCDCCGDGEYWYGIPGEHYNHEDPPGHDGPYDYNGGLCECH